MPIRVVRLAPRHPLAVAGLALVVLVLLALIVVFGLALAAGAAVVGAVALVARRVLGLGGAREAPRPAVADEAPGARAWALDPRNEVFAPDEGGDRPRLPPAER